MKASIVPATFPSLARTGVALSLVAATFGSGCLASTYRIPHGELQTLAQTAPAERGKKVRVVQNVGDQDDPPGATRVESSTTVIIVGDGGHSSYGGGSGGGRASGNGVRPGGGHGPSGKLAADDGKAWLGFAAVVAVALAATEGARYDGWVAMHPMMPVHLFGPNGEYMVVPLAQLTPELASWADHAVVRETEGPWSEQGRAPLDRQGFTYSLLFVSAQMPSFNDDKTAGFQGHIQLGYFPVQQFGLQLDIGLGSRQNEMGLSLFDGRYALEADIYPVQIGPLHAGLFGQVGKAQRIEDGGPENRDRSGNLFGGGALVQLDLTTRLALTARGGYMNVMGEGATEGLLGLSIY
jgi:hypothetical protein